MIEKNNQKDRQQLEGSSLNVTQNTNLLPLLTLIEELIQGQRYKIRKVAGTITEAILTDDDLLQPNDYPELEGSPEFRYEEGVLAGFLSVKAALLSNRSTSR